MSNMDKLMCNYTWTFLSKNDVQLLPSVLSLFWRKKFFMGPKRKHLNPTIYFPSSPSNQTQSKKFTFLFSLQKFSSTIFQLQTNTKDNSKDTYFHPNLRYVEMSIYNLICDGAAKSFFSFSLRTRGGYTFPSILKSKKLEQLGTI